MSAPEKTAGSTAEVKPTTLAELSAAFPDLVAQARADGASAERERIIGIDKLAANRKGVAGLVSEMKADATCTVEKAAMRILDHEGKQLAAQAANIQSVEDVAKVVKAAPAAGATDAQHQASTPDGWKAEFEKDKKLQDEFGTVERYVAFKQGCAEGTVRVLSTRAAG